MNRLRAHFVMGDLAVKHLEGHVLAGAGVAGLVDVPVLPRASTGPSSKWEIVWPVRTPSSVRIAGWKADCVRLHQLLGIGDRRGVQLHPGLADLELLAVLQGVLLDLLPADERSADAVPVDQQELASCALQLAMEPRDGPVRQPRVGLLATADRQRRSLDQVEDATLIGAGDHPQISVHGEPLLRDRHAVRVRRQVPPRIRCFARTRAVNQEEMKTSWRGRSIAVAILTFEVIDASDGIAQRRAGRLSEVTPITSVRLARRIGRHDFRRRSRWL